MQPQSEQHKPCKPKIKLTLKNIPTKSRFLQDPCIGTPLVSSTTISANPVDDTLEAFMEKYELLEKIGQGANGVVYRCRHKKMDKIFAAKKSRTEIQSIPHLKSSYSHTKMLEHQHIINYKGLYIARQKGVSYLVMEYFEHPELGKVKIRGQMQVSKIAYQLLEAVAYMHQMRVCHRDIKPDNILYDQKNQHIKVMDFGESKATRDGRLVKIMMTCTGTLQYKAPELFRGGCYDELIDEWAVGVTIYELLTGRKPFQSEYKATIIENIENCRVTFEEQFWSKHPGRWAKELIEQLLSPRQSRITAANALKSLWFEGHASTLKSTNMNSKKNSYTPFKSVTDQINNKDQQGSKKNINAWAPIIIGKEIIDSEEEYISDEDEEQLQNDNKPKSRSESGEDRKREKSQEKCSTEGKWSILKDQDEIKSPLMTEDTITVPKMESELEIGDQY